MPNPTLTTLDLVCLVMDSKERPLDFALFLRFDRDLGADSLARGALSARKLYASTGCGVVDGQWIPLGTGACEAAFRLIGPQDADSQVKRFLQTPFKLASEPPIRQAWVSNRRARGGCLVTRIHHCAADLLSAFAWIRHQLRVAADVESAQADPTQVVPPALAQPPPRAKRNPVWERCAPLWTRPGNPSATRHWTTFSLPHGALADLNATTSGFTLNDVLSVAALETLHEWNRDRGATGHNVGIWLPVNIREDPFAGFGNASSRIRVRRNYADGLGFVDKCRAVRSQVNLARQRGEWVVPKRPALARIPLRFSGPLIRQYLNRPWADMGSAAFSHVQKWPGQADPVFAGLREIGVLGAMHRRHALMFAAVTVPGRTWMTITYDPALLWPEDIAAIKHSYSSAVETASHGL